MGVGTPYQVAVSKLVKDVGDCLHSSEPSNMRDRTMADRDGLLTQGDYTNIPPILSHLVKWG